ncbi:MAG: hypothetical protein KBD63_01675 [Bacteriovoracaceae bacterium]|nr:hypothetical protein [Bacteriovoracaceae bacterium]
MSYDLISMKKIAAIDIGSNALRLAIAEIHAHDHLVVTKRVRIPLRLGGDAFSQKTFSETTMNKTERVFKNFKKILKDENVEEISALATSAFRESANSPALSERIEKSSGIKIKTIDGIEEANTIYLGISPSGLLQNESAVLIDLGGGSLEITLVKKGMLVKTHSFDLGTLRLLNLKNKKERKEFLNKFSQDITEFIKNQDLSKTCLIGTGGNLRRLGKLRKKVFKKDDITFMRKAEINSLYEKAKDISLLNRAKKLDLQINKAEVLIPTLEVLRMLFTLIPANRIILPNLGLIDGIFQRILLKEKTKHIALF